MSYQINVEEAKQLIGDMALEIFALRRDNIKLSEALEKLNERKIAKMPDPRQDLEMEKNG
jgi:hypothetical protein